MHISEEILGQLENYCQIYQGMEAIVFICSLLNDLNRKQFEESETAEPNSEKVRDQKY